ncbi:MAG: hypothetical protein QG670_2742 [Thermoproteota archaeon]|nr:hypothetical protein [Thermoproteota archaeon]
MDESELTSKEDDNDSKKDLSNVEAWNKRGLTLDSMGKLDEALESFDEALKIERDIPVIWNNRGIILQKMGKLKEALESFDKALKLRGDDSKAWFNRGNVLFIIDRFKEALESYDKALKLDPKSFEVWNNRGMSLQKMGKLNEAIKSYAKALSLKTDYAGAWYNLGNVLGSLGRLGEALDALEEALKWRINLPDRGERIYPVWTRLICFNSKVAIERKKTDETKELAKRFKVIFEDAKKDGMDKIIIENEKKLEEDPKLKASLQKLQKLVSESE